MKSSVPNTISDHQLELLITKAIAIKEKAYCPYSNFRVGCAILCKDGTVFTGIEFFAQQCKTRESFTKDPKKVFFINKPHNQTIIFLEKITLFDNYIVL
jgi:hypothetical protein